MKRLAESIILAGRLRDARIDGWLELPYPGCNWEAREFINQCLDDYDVAVRAMATEGDRLVRAAHVLLSCLHSDLPVAKNCETCIAWVCPVCHMCPGKYTGEHEPCKPDCKRGRTIAAAEAVKGLVESAVAALAASQPAVRA